jgi:capsular exopolysaccharide synthesis family protein
MSRIQDILSKAERDGTARRTRALADEAIGPQPLDRPAPVAAAPVAMPPRRSEVISPLPPPAAWTPAPARPDRGLEIDPPGADGSRGALDQHLVAAIAPSSLAAEQYRSLRTRIKRAENGRAVRTIVVTSPSKGDGKSLTAANLALTMAQEFQQRVLLVDGDLRRPAVHQLFGVAEGPGLSDVLLGAAELDHALVELPDYHLALLPAGGPPAHPAELLGSAAMRRVLDTLRNRYDRILIDMPPVAPLADLHIVAPLIDGLLMIVRAGITPKPAIERALAGLDMTKVLGLVLNESGGESSEAYNYEGYGYIAG